ncbi:MAG: hypothetical protein HAW67_01710 [Endozoicomonadaceae bacterium]|nr:hypothetical protein [Endozoicomonadaceae bacterium]
MGWLTNLQKVVSSDYADHFFDLGYDWSEARSLGKVIERAEEDGYSIPERDWEQYARLSSRGRRNYISENFDDGDNDRDRDRYREDDGDRDRDRDDETPIADLSLIETIANPFVPVKDDWEYLREEGFSDNQIRRLSNRFPQATRRERDKIIEEIRDISNSDNIGIGGWDRLTSTQRGDKALEIFIKRGSIDDPGKVTEELSKIEGTYTSVDELDTALGKGRDTGEGLKTETSEFFLNQSREQYEKSKDIQKEVGKDADRFRDSAEDERRRRLRLEDKALKGAQSTISEAKRERAIGIQQFLQARKSYTESRTERQDLIKEIREAPSTYEEAQRQAMNQSLKNQASLLSNLPTRGGGSGARELLDRQQESDLNIAQASSVGRLQELEGRRNSIGALLSQQSGQDQSQQQLDLGFANSSLDAGKFGLLGSQTQLQVAGQAGRQQQLDNQNVLQSYGLGLQAVGLGNSGLGSSIGSNLQTSQFLNDKDNSILDRLLGLAGAGLSAGSKLF